MYLLHLTVIYQLFINTRTYSMENNNASQVGVDLFLKFLETSNFKLQVVHFIGLVAVSFACSLVFVLAFEAPFMHLQKLLLGGNIYRETL